MPTCEPLASLSGFVNAVLGDVPSANAICIYDSNADGFLDGHDIGPFIDRLLAP
jgi:hypothetical protein